MKEDFRKPCPFLPVADKKMSYRDLRALRENENEAYYLGALRYGNTLWQRGHSGRALLALTRALYLDLSQDSSVYQRWSLPYSGMGWILQAHPSNDFPGNPRVSFQHQATRIRGQRASLLRARAWAIWALVRIAKPDLRADQSQPIAEPTFSEIEENLKELGHRDESYLWAQALEGLGHTSTDE